MPKPKKAAAAELRAKYPKQHAAYLDMQSRANSRGKEATRKERVYGTKPWRMEVQRRCRLSELDALMHHRYGRVPTIGDDALHAHVDIIELARHAFASAKPVEMVESSVKWWCRNCSLRTVSTILKAAQVWKPLHAAEVGKRVMLTARERDELRITTIKPADETPLQALRRLRERKRRNRDAHRRRRGVQTRDEYAWAAREQPWEFWKICESTWRRRGKPVPPVGWRDAASQGCMADVTEVRHRADPEGVGKGGDTLLSAAGDGATSATSQRDAPSREAKAVLHHFGRQCGASARAAVAVKRRPLRGHPGGDTTVPVLTPDTVTWGTA